MAGLRFSITMAHFAIVICYLIMLHHLGLTWEKMEFWIMVLLLYLFEVNCTMYVKHSIMEKIEELKRQIDSSNQEDDKDA